MKEKEKFICNLNKYYNHLLDRFDNGSKYVCNMKNNIYGTREYVAYENIIKELSEVEKLLNYYKYM